MGWAPPLERCPNCRAPLAAPSPPTGLVHLIRADISLACGHDGHDRASAVPGEVTCPSCLAAAGEA